MALWEFAYRVWNTIANLFRRDRLESELKIEMESHLHYQEEQNKLTGMSPEKARKEANINFGNPNRIEEDARDAWGTRAVFDLLRDIQFSFRQILAHRWYSAAIILILALGIGINTTVFTLTNAMLFKPLSVPNGERIVLAQNIGLQGRHFRNDNEAGLQFSYFEYLAYKEMTESVESVTVAKEGWVVITSTGGHSERLKATYASHNVFEIVNAQPIRGRVLKESDSDSAAEKVAVISYKLWQNWFLGDDDIIGKTVRIDRRPTTIVGVMADGVLFPWGHDIWVPVAPPEEQHLVDRSKGWMGTLIVLLKPETTIEAARSEFAGIANRLAIEFPESNENVGVTLKTFPQYHHGGDIGRLFQLMLGAVGFVLLIACSNGANMMLSKNVGRRFEFSMRATLGASRWQVVRLMLVESVTLSLIGGLLGVVIAMMGVSFFDRFTRAVPERLYWIDFSLDQRVVIYFVAISVLSGILFGLLPALKITRTNPGSSLRAWNPSFGDKGTGRISGSLVAFQFAMTFALLFGAGLLVRGFVNVQSASDSKHMNQLFSARPDFYHGVGDKYQDVGDKRRFFDEVLEKLKVTPGVVSAGVSSSFPGASGRFRPVEIYGRPVPEKKDAPRVRVTECSPEFLTVIDSPVLEGRGFNDFDGKDGQLAAIVTVAFARQHWRDESAIGKRFRVSSLSEKWCVVIGVCVEPEHVIGASAEAPPVIYLPFFGGDWSNGRFVVRTEVGVADMSQAFRSIVREVDSDLTFWNLGSMEQLMKRDYWHIGVFGTLFSIFALAGLLLASVGIYAVVSYSNLRKAKEIGIRMALGSSVGQAVRLVFMKGARFVALGLSLGLLLALGLGSFMPRFLLVGVDPRDPVVLVAVFGILLGVGLFACWLPARQVAKCHPAAVLHRD